MLGVIAFRPRATMLPGEEAIDELLMEFSSFWRLLASVFMRLKLPGTDDLAPTILHSYRNRTLWRNSPGV